MFSSPSFSISTPHSPVLLPLGHMACASWVKYLLLVVLLKSRFISLVLNQASPVLCSSICAQYNNGSERAAPIT